MTGIDRFFSGLRISASGLAAERLRMDVIAENIANARTTRTADGGPYRRKVVVFEPMVEQAGRPGARGRGPGARRVDGVRAARVEFDPSSAAERVHEPGHPDADADGMVSMPNVNTLREMADLITAMRTYDAGIAAQEAFVRSAERALELLR
jgi:flagellar basal-body rod protein FlgC